MLATIGTRLTAVTTELWAMLVATVPDSVPSGDDVKDAVETVVDEPAITNPTNWIVSGIMVAVGVLFGYWIRRLIRRASKRSDSETATVQIVSQLVFGAIVSVAILLALDNVGIDLTPLFAGAGIVGLVLGFALKDIAENYVAGVIMGFSNPFAPGDRVIVEDGRLEGIVEELQLRYTVIRSTDGVRILMPNSLVLKNPVENLTANGHRRSYFTVGVAFDTELDAACELAAKSVTGLDGVNESPAPEAFVEELAGSWVTIRVRFWHGPSGHDRWDTRSRAITAVLDAFTDAGIDMPFHTQTLSIEGDIPSGTSTGRDVDDRSGDGSERQ